MRTIATVIALLAACGPGSGPTQAGGDNAPEIHALFAPSNAVSVTAHGATPARDNIDERAFLQAAIDAACAAPADASGWHWLTFPSGDYSAARPIAPGVKSSLTVSGCKLKMVGAGMGSTTIAQIGTGMLPTHPTEPGTWKLLWLTGGSTVSIDGISFEGGKRTVDTEEQTYLVEVGDTVDVNIRNSIMLLPQRPRPVGSVECLTAPDGVLCQRPNHGDHTPIYCHQYLDTSVTPAVTRPGLKGAVCRVDPSTDPENPAPVWTLLGWYGGGDCLHLFADPGVARDVVVDSVFALNCDRSGLGGQRGVDGATITNSTWCGEAPWDFEATGAGGLKRVVARGNTLCGAGASYSATNGGQGANGLTSVDFDCAGSPITKGGVSVLDADIVTYSNCTIDSGLVSEASTIDVRKRGNVVKFRRSVITRPVGAPTAAVVNITHHSGAAPTTVIFEDVTLVQGTKAPFIDAKSIGTLQLQRVTMRYITDPWLKPVPGQPPPANHTEAAAIIADTVSGSPQSVDAVILIDVKMEAPAGAFAELLRQSQHDSWPGSRRVIMSKVDARGALRNALVLFKGSAVTQPVSFDYVDVLHDAPVLCMGADCP
jgi:hypothetical protein